MTGNVSVCCPIQILNQNLLSKVSWRNTCPNQKTKRKKSYFVKVFKMRFSKRR